MSNAIKNSIGETSTEYKAFDAWTLFFIDAVDRYTGRRITSDDAAVIFNRANHTLDLLMESRYISKRVYNNTVSRVNKFRDIVEWEVFS